MKKSVSTTEIISDIRNIVSKLGRRELGRSEYLRYGRFSAYDIYDGGRTWEELCSAAGVKTKKKEAVPDDVYFERLQRAVEQLGSGAAQRQPN